MVYGTPLLSLSFLRRATGTPKTLDPTVQGSEKEYFLDFGLCVRREALSLKLARKQCARCLESLE